MNEINQPLTQEEFTFAVERGQRVTQEVYENCLNVLPPIGLKGGQGYWAGFQVGEPYCHKVDQRTGKWRPMFATFTMAGNEYVYQGINFAGEVDSRPYAA